MLSRLALVIVALGLPLKPTLGATIELARSVDGHTLGVRIEGKIEPGDADKLLKIYVYFGPAAASKVFLWSPGGNLQESIKIGRLIRQLRLSTYAPDRLSMLGIFDSGVAPIDKSNNLCASACVLVFAGGVMRIGDLLILHRPFLLLSEADERISDVDFETAEKHAIDTARDYLREMELPDYYIDKMIATSSQDGYLPTAKDLQEHPISDLAPSIEEIILSKCQSLNAAEQRRLDEYYLAEAASAAAKGKRKAKVFVDSELLAKSNAYEKCQSEQLVELQLAAWNRLNEGKVSSTCSQAEPSQSADCRNKALKQLTDNALDRGSHAKPGDTAPAEFSVDTSIFYDQEPGESNQTEASKSNPSSFSIKFLPVLVIAFSVVCLLALVLSLFAIWRRTRGPSGFGLLIASTVLGVITWLVGAIVTFASFGWPGLFIGVFVLGIGVVPIGIVGAVFALHINGLAAWLCIMIVATLASRYTGVACLASADHYNLEQKERRIAQAAQGALEHEFGRSVTD
jgi:hypothetical protein